MTEHDGSPGQETISKKIKQDGETVFDELDQKQIKTVERLHGGAIVKIQVGRTVNTGDFEFLRVDVGVELPCKDDAQAIQYAFGRARDIVQFELRATLGRQGAREPGV